MKNASHTFLRVFGSLVLCSLTACTSCNHDYCTSDWLNQVENLHGYPVVRDWYEEAPAATTPPPVVVQHTTVVMPEEVVTPPPPPPPPAPAAKKHKLDVREAS